MFINKVALGICNKEETFNQNSSYNLLQPNTKIYKKWHVLNDPIQDYLNPSAKKQKKSYCSCLWIYTKFYDTPKSERLN